jgi:hypothetical protein
LSSINKTAREGLVTPEDKLEMKNMLLLGDALSKRKVHGLLSVLMHAQPVDEPVVRMRPADRGMVQRKSLSLYRQGSGRSLNSSLTRRGSTISQFSGYSRPISGGSGGIITSGAGGDIKGTGGNGNSGVRRRLSRRYTPTHAPKQYSIVISSLTVSRIAHTFASSREGSLLERRGSSAVLERRGSSAERWSEQQFTIRPSKRPPLTRARSFQS